MHNSTSMSVQTVFNISPNALIAISPEGCIHLWNGGAETLLGYTQEEAIGTYLQDILLFPGEREDAMNTFHNTRQNGATIYEAIRRRKDSSLISVNVSHYKIQDEQGNIEYIVICKEDT